MRAYRFFLPSPSSIRQERSAFLFREKGSAKLRSHEPPRASLSIFPPHVTLRFGILKRQKMSHQDQFNVEKAATTAFCSVSYLPCEQESGLSWWRAVWSSFWFCPLVLSGADPFLGAAGRGPSSPSLWSVWLKKPVGGSSTRQCCCHLTRSDRPNRTRVRRKKKQEWWYLPREAVAWGLRFRFDTFWAEPRHQTPLSHEGRSSSSWQCWQTNRNIHFVRHQSALICQSRVYSNGPCFMTALSWPTVLDVASRFSPDIQM